MSEGILDVRTYRLKPGVADAFTRRFADNIGPMLQRYGIKVVHFGQSLIDTDSFCLPIVCVRRGSGGAAVRILRKRGMAEAA